MKNNPQKSDKLEHIRSEPQFFIPTPFQLLLVPFALAQLALESAKLKLGIESRKKPKVETYITSEEYNVCKRWIQNQLTSFDIYKLTAVTVLGAFDEQTRLEKARLVILKALSDKIIERTSGEQGLTSSCYIPTSFCNRTVRELC